MHDCEHDHAHDDDAEPASTGFLPISLALGLFITGLFVLDVVPLPHCGSSPSAQP
jgi:hypothetical protein